MLVMFGWSIRGSEGENVKGLAECRRNQSHFCTGSFNMREFIVLYFLWDFISSLILIS